MKNSTKDQVKGKFHEVKGSVKEAVGKAINNPKVAIEGYNELTCLGSDQANSLNHESYYPNNSCFLCLKAPFWD